jgi:hypothetical protein
MTHPTNRHLEHHGTIRPHVARVRVSAAALLPHLPGHILRRAGELLLAVREVVGEGGEAKVSKDEIAGRVEEDVGWLDVAVDDAACVHLLKGEELFTGQRCRTDIICNLRAALHRTGAEAQG